MCLKTFSSLDITVLFLFIRTFNLFSNIRFTEVTTQPNLYSWQQIIYVLHYSFSDAKQTSFSNVL